MSIRIISPGPLTTVQDLGFFGQQKNGFPGSGVMDRDSAVTANLLCSNPRGEAVLEMTLLGIDAFFTDDCVFALSGADMKPRLNGTPVDMNTSVKANAGDRLTLGKAVCGCRCYLAVSGGIDVPPVMGSRSTVLRLALGGFEGRKLKAGDVIPTAKAHSGVAGRSLPYEGCHASAIELRAVPGPQEDYFTPSAIDTFFSSEYTVTAQSDRMGIRLEGERLESVSGTDILSDGIVFGSVQVPSGGQPIVLMADRQTTGGYAKIATVISADLSLLAQAVPGDRVKFVKTDAASAAVQLKEREAAYRKLEEKWNIQK